MFYGQSQQDKFVLNVLNGKRYGFFLEIGSNHPININNTYILERHYNWSGIMVEYNPSFLPLYKEQRTNSLHVINDATKIDYKTLFENNNVPVSIDYLQIDLEVINGSTIQTLQKLDAEVLNKYKFATVTFEHDIYHTNYANTRLTSREIFYRNGYICVFEDISNEGNPYEDWYVHPDLVDMNYVNILKEKNMCYYVNNSITGKSLNYMDIVY